MTFCKKCGKALGGDSECCHHCEISVATSEEIRDSSKTAVKNASRASSKGPHEEMGLSPSDEAKPGGQSPVVLWGMVLGGLMAICLGLFFGGYRDAAEGHAEPVVMVEPAVAAPDVGTLVVTSAPVGATVTFLSGSHVYRDNMPLETGTYKIRVFKPGYTPNGKQVTVEKGQTTRVFVALKAGVR